MGCGTREKAAQEEGLLFICGSCWKEKQWKEFVQPHALRMNRVTAEPCPLQHSSLSPGPAPATSVVFQKLEYDSDPSGADPDPFIQPP